jgi:hypothetical protein
VRYSFPATVVSTLHADRDGFRGLSFVYLNVVNQFSNMLKIAKQKVLYFINNQNGKGKSKVVTVLN